MAKKSSPKVSKGVAGKPILDRSIILKFVL